MSDLKTARIPCCCRQWQRGSDTPLIYGKTAVDLSVDTKDQETQQETNMSANRQGTTLNRTSQETTSHQNNEDQNAPITAAHRVSNGDT